MDLNFKNIHSLVPEIRNQLPEFIKNRVSDVDHITNLIHESQYEEIQKIAHDWKGFSAPYGFGKLTVFATELSQHAKYRNPQKCYKLLDEITEYINEKKQILEDFV